MNSEQLKLLCFYCWQLNIATLGDLAKWAAQHKATTNKTLLEELAKAYNGKEWEIINNIK